MSESVGWGGVVLGQAAQQGDGGISVMAGAVNLTITAKGSIINPDDANRLVGRVQPGMGITPGMIEVAPDGTLTLPSGQVVGKMGGWEGNPIGPINPNNSPYNNGGFQGPRGGGLPNEPPGGGGGGGGNTNMEVMVSVMIDGIEQTEVLVWSAWYGNWIPAAVANILDMPAPNGGQAGEGGASR